MNRYITKYEHDPLKLDELSNAQLRALQSFHGEGIPYFSLIHQGIKFCEFVGVLQVGETVIEVLPKADKNKQENDWRNILIGMLRVVAGFEVEAPTSTNLHLRQNAILNLYFELFISETEKLLHKGLVKRYRTIKSNNTALKGQLQFAQHVQKNLVHQERFFVAYTIYDNQNNYNAILYQTLIILRRINAIPHLQSRINALLMNFPEMPNIQVTEALFNTIKFSRKTIAYKKAIGIARMILLNYHPDLRKGQENVLALMFNMNQLWEKFVFLTLKKCLSQEFYVIDQKPVKFWKPYHGNTSSLKPDILIETKSGDKFVLDTKWKNQNGASPTSGDIRQMYAYLQYTDSRKAALVYPSDKQQEVGGEFYLENGDGKELSGKKCSLISFSANPKVNEWQKDISRFIQAWATNQ